jgi:Zn-dependent protease
MNVGNGALAAAFASIILVNLFLGAFNLIPLPPLDGSKLLFAFIPDRFFTVKVLLERYGIFLFIFLILLFANALRPLIMHLYFLLVPQTF